MSVSDALDELLVRWQELRRRGESPSVRVLCTEHPELADELRQRIAAFESMEAMLGIGPGGTLPSSSPPTAQGVPPHLAEKLLPLGYDLIELIDHGGMGVVYKATQVELRRTVALKMIAGISAGPKQLARFRAEAEAVARLQHPHIVQIYDVSQVDGHSFFAMEYVEGGTLAHRLQTGPLGSATAAELLEVLARAVHHAHTRGVVHRDLKPANVLLAGESSGAGSTDRSTGGSTDEFPQVALMPASNLPAQLTPKLTDFGLAKRLGADAGHTTTGEVIGTPAYMAPEQARGETRTIGPACDVYALGAILYEALTGQAPFRGASLLETLRQVLADEPVPPRHVNSRIPRDLEAICLKCLEKKPAKRYASAEALADDLRRFVTGQPVEARRTIPARAIKWARRHPLLLATISALLSLVVGAVVANAAREHWDRKREGAERERIRKRAIEVAPQARDILKKHCYECHGDTRGGKKVERGFHVFDRESLLNADRKNVVPGNPNSRLIERIIDGSMPPEKDDDGWRPRVHETEVAILKEWILGGAPEFPPEDPSNPTPPVVPRSELAAQVFEIFDRRCTGCHSVAEANGGIRILNHNLLLQRRVLVPSKDGEDPELYRLVGPAIQKLKMPKNGGRLPPHEVNTIKQWLDAGAPPFPPRLKKK